MEIISHGGRFVLVTGMARSGTTLLTSIINSADNAVVLCEPYNSLLHWDFFYTDKLGPPQGKHRCGVFEIVSWLEQMTRDKYGVIGAKEVIENAGPEEFGKWDSHLLVDYALPFADTVLVCMRNPVDIVQSQVERLGFTFEKSLMFMSNFMWWVGHQNKKRDLYFVQYEQLCADPIRHLNEVLTGRLWFEGELNKKPMIGHGDNWALNSAWVNPAVIRRQDMSQDRVALVQTLAGDWFNKCGLSRKKECLGD